MQTWTLNAHPAQPAVVWNGLEAFGAVPGQGRELLGATTPAGATPRVRRPAVAEAAPDAAASVLALPQPDWLRHELTVTGPAEQVTAYRTAAAGAGIVPWVYNYDRMEEDWFLLLMAPPAHRRGISAEGARILALGLRDLVWARHEFAVSRVGLSTACPFDLHRLVPVPNAILRLGDDHPDALAWTWQHWGTTWTLRRVTEQPLPAAMQRRLSEGQAAMRVSFWSADCRHGLSYAESSPSGRNSRSNCSRHIDGHHRPIRARVGSTGRPRQGARDRQAQKWVTAQD